MYALRLLGPPSLTGPTGAVSGRLAQERKLALLAVLALAKRRTLTRDSLAAMFWPDSDASRARHNVADCVWTIRSTLGDDAVTSRGSRLTLDNEVVTTDVEFFEAALRARDPAGAVALYAGPFMDGFHISGAPEFEHWLDRKRSSLAAECAGALDTLARDALAAGRPEAAVAWARRLTDADPLNTRRALLVMEALAASGDVAGAVRSGERHAALLAEELALAPPAELEARIGALRAMPAAVTGAAPAAHLEAAAGATAHSAIDDVAREVEVPRRAEQASSPERAAQSEGTPKAKAHRPWRGRRAPALLAVAGAAAVMAAWLWPGRTSADIADPVPDRIVVLAFENRTGDPELDLLGRLAADVLVRGLANAGVGDVVLPAEPVGSYVGAGDTRAGPRQAQAAARELLAGIAVSGTLDPNPGGAVLVATIATGGGRVAAVLDAMRVDAAAPGPALERLSSRVVGTLAAHLGQKLPEHPFVVRMPSYESYRLADRATNEFVERRHAAAASLFRDAYALDTTAVGYLLWAAIAIRNAGQTAVAWEILEELRPRRDELSPFDAAQFHWLEAAATGNRPEALHAARVAHALHPHSGLGGFQLGLELTRSGLLEEALDVYRGLDPDRGWLARYPFYWNNLAAVNHLLGRHEEELAAAEEGYRRHVGPIMLNARVRALAAMGREDELRRALREATTPAGHAVTAARALRRHAFDSLAVVVAEEGLQALAASPLDAGSIAAAVAARRNNEAMLLMAAGRLAEARVVLLELLAADSTDRDLLGWTGFVEAGLGLETDARRRIAALERLGREPFTNGGPTVARAAIHAELGDDPALVRLLLEQSHREGWPLHSFHFTPLFDAVREHPDVRDFFRVGR